MRAKAETLAKVEIDARGNEQENLEAYVVVDTLADKLAEVEVLTVNETLAQQTAHAYSNTRSQASRGAE